MKYWSTPTQAERVITKVVLNASGETGVYFDDEGHPMLPSTLVQDPSFTACVVAETRALMVTTPVERSQRYADRFWGV